MFQIINNQQTKPTLEQYQIINTMLKMFEEKHKNDKTSKGKKLIQYKYLEREIRYL
jgi:hypothetical protein